jgi:hypothetical protein
MEPEYPVQCQQEATQPYPEPNEPKPLTATLFI